MIDQEFMKRRIVQILEYEIQKDCKEIDIGMVIKKFKEFITNMTDNTNSLTNLLSSFNNEAFGNEYESPGNKLFAHNEIIKSSNKIINYNEYLQIKLPLYLIHFIKYCKDTNVEIPRNIYLTNYGNLLKEQNYKNQRDASQIIIMWKDMGNNRYALLSFITTDLNELDIDQDKYFISYVGGKTTSQVEHTWEKYNRTKLEDLIKLNKLKNIKECLLDLLVEVVPL